MAANRNANRPSILSEVTPVSDRECFFLEDRYKEAFTYPMHKHSEFELNLICGCTGVRRVVGDSLEILGDHDLCLLGRGVEHEWQQHECKNTDIYEITLQFADDLLSGRFVDLNCMMSIRRLLKDGEKGVVFPEEVFEDTKSRMIAMRDEPVQFNKLLRMLEILYFLSRTNYRTLASHSFVKAPDDSESRRVQKVKDYVAENFKKEIYLQDLARLADMTPTAFSRFFRLFTHKSISEYIMDVRLGYAARKLVDSNMSVREICYSSGFNNFSYFNRAFKRRRGCTPTEFRTNFRKAKDI